jgi:phosphoribosylamine--glycine ligase
VIPGAGRAGIIHAGTERRAGDDALVSAGGRVLSGTGLGADLSTAREAAYALVAGIGLDGAQYRRDIAALAASNRLDAPQRT